MKSMWTTTLLLTLANAAMAAESGHDAHGAAHHGPDMTLVMWQALNVGILIIGLIYFLRKPVREFFAGQKAAYLDASAKTLAARTAAENDLKHIRAELNRIETTAAESVARARAESSDLKRQMVTEAESTAQRLRMDAETSAKLEVQRAVVSLRAELLQEAVAAARQQMSKGVTQEDHVRLNQEFIRNIEASQS